MTNGGPSSASAGCFFDGLGIHDRRLRHRLFFGHQRAERLPRVGAHDAGRFQPGLRLKLLHGFFGFRTEIAVDADARRGLDPRVERPLQRLDQVAFRAHCSTRATGATGAAPSELKY